MFLVMTGQLEQLNERSDRVTHWPDHQHRSHRHASGLVARSRQREWHIDHLGRSVLKGSRGRCCSPQSTRRRRSRGIPRRHMRSLTASCCGPQRMDTLSQGRTKLIGEERLVPTPRPAGPQMPPFDLRLGKRDFERRQFSNLLKHRRDFSASI